MKGISPIIASVLLIAITMSIAVVLAAYVTNYTRQQTQAIPNACIGGALFFTSGSPTVDTGTCKITAGIEGQFVPLSSFKVEVDKSGVISQPATTGTLSLAPGDAGTVYATSSPCTGADTITNIRVTTNCFNVRTEWTPPQ